MVRMATIADRTREALLSNHKRSNSVIAQQVGATNNRWVRKIRRQLEDAGSVPMWRERDFGLQSEIEAALLSNHERSNSVVARDVGSTNTSWVGTVRRQLEDAGSISVWRSYPGWASSMCTYIVKGLMTGRFKVGISCDMDRRLKELQSHSPDDLTIFAIIPGVKWEKILHERLADHHCHGEWFERNDATKRIVFEVLEEAGIEIS